jgi:hypothetical protein
MGYFVDGELADRMFLIKSDSNRASQIQRSIIGEIHALVSRQAIDFLVPFQLNRANRSMITSNLRRRAELPEGFLNAILFHSSLVGRTCDVLLMPFGIKTTVNLMQYGINFTSHVSQMGDM